MLLSAIKSVGLLGMNRRNADYLLPQNPRKLYPLVDDKLKTKELLDLHHIPTPELYFTLSGNFELRGFREIKFLNDFVVKPARGAEGRGILVLAGKRGKDWVKSSGDIVTMADLEYHITNILAGLYSLGGVDDTAFIEYRVHSHHSFSKIAYQGVPDIRVILYRGIPIMGMLRLPTHESDGKANLHQGAVGVGIEMCYGVTCGGVYKNRFIQSHPDTHAVVAGIKIPFWKEILEIAAKIFDLFPLGYLGVDFVIDHLLGPMILELNARPGLNIQLANRQGLMPRLKRLDSMQFNSQKIGAHDRLELMGELLAGG